MPEALNCWKCGKPVTDEPLPLGRRAECRHCRAELHVCRQCRYYDSAKAKHCAEPVADEVGDKTRANFCGWFEPRHGLRVTNAPTTNADALAALFGAPAPAEAPPDDARAALVALFKPPDKQ